MVKVGFIGCGNMGSAIARAVSNSKLADVYLTDLDESKVSILAKEINAVVSNINEICNVCDYVFFAVKPNVMIATLESVKDEIDNRGNEIVLVTIAAGLKLDVFLRLFPKNPIIRIMPNTPVQIGMGTIQYCDVNVSNNQKNIFFKFMSKAGLIDELPEKLIDAASAVSGCGPAYAYMFIEALADGAVACGLPRNKALLYASNMLAGSALMVQQSEKHPENLKDDVCSPGGTTIQGVRTLEKFGFRSAVQESVIAAYDKTLELSK